MTQVLMDLLAACHKTRQIAASTLEESLREALAKPDPVTEVALRDLWLAKLRGAKSIYPDGWYMPPPHGMFVQFATDEDPSRVNQTSNRRPEAWPRNDIYLDRANGLVSAYASPVDRDTGMIGDFCVMLYFGKSPAIQTHLAEALKLDAEVFERLEPGMEYADIARITYEQLEAHGFANTVASPTDPTGTNVGHTLPGADTGWTAAEKAVFAAGDWEATKNMMSHKRLFLNTSEHAKIPPTSGHTIEPRPEVPGHPELPAAPYHTMVFWREGTKQFITGFSRLFELAGMDYMPKIKN
ncbi:MAG TPA: hypothetical protein VHQ86_02665 [Candidatus Saccharimonadia bacterium]|jgi:hypothetical protein|nr:hypothetical protein [Candidatus Saccharimonadia bacterium]